MSSSLRPPFFGPLTFRIPYSVRCPRCVAGFTLLEILATIAIVIVLVGLLVPGLSSAFRKAGMAKDTANLRNYSAALHSMSNDLEQVSAGDVIRSGSTKVDQYCGGAANAEKLLNSPLWTKMTKAFAASQGKTVTTRTRSYTLNQILFPPKTQQPGQPPPNGWEIDPTTPARLRSEINKPLLFTGVFLNVHNGAYNWGGRSHSNPIYSDLTKTSVTNTIMGKSLVLFVGGHVRLVDFSKDNLPVAGDPDPEKWWTKTN